VGQSLNLVRVPEELFRGVTVIRNLKNHQDLVEKSVKDGGDNLKKKSCWIGLLKL